VRRTAVVVRHTPYYHKLIERGAEIVDRIGYQCAFRFTTVEEEHRRTREAVGVFDIYHQGPIEVQGRDAAAVLDLTAARDILRRLTEDGKALYTSLIADHGGMIDDLIVYRLAEDRYWVVPTPARAEVVEEHLRSLAVGLCAHVSNLISGTAYLSIQGPRSRSLLSRLTEADLSGERLPYFRLTRAVVAQVPAILSRTGYSGELGYELFFPREYAEHVWDAVFAAGEDLGALPAGLGALRSLRIEKRYPLYGLDVDESTTPFEAGLGWAVDLSKERLLGKDVLERVAREGPSRLLILIQFQGLEHVPQPGARVLFNGEEVGKVTSADRGWSVGKALALAYVDPRVAVPDASVKVETPEGRLVGSVSLNAVYDPQGSRVRA
jgi:aminomethyltransferase